MPEVSHWNEYARIWRGSHFPKYFLHSVDSQENPYNFLFFWMKKQINNFHLWDSWSRQWPQVGCWCSSAGQRGLGTPLRWLWWTQVSLGWQHPSTPTTSGVFGAEVLVLSRQQSSSLSGHSLCVVLYGYNTSHFNHCSWLNWPYALWRGSLEVAEVVLAEGRSSFAVAQEPHEGKECRSGGH